MDLEQALFELNGKFGGLVATVDSMDKRIDGNHKLVMTKLDAIEDNCTNQCSKNGGNGSGGSSNDWRNNTSDKLDRRVVSVIVSVWEFLPLWMRVIITTGGTIGGIAGILFSTIFLVHWFVKNF